MYRCATERRVFLYFIIIALNRFSLFLEGVGVVEKTRREVGFVTSCLENLHDILTPWQKVLRNLFFWEHVMASRRPCRAQSLSNSACTQM